jgi:hypothetical protein
MFMTSSCMFTTPVQFACHIAAVFIDSFECNCCFLGTLPVIAGILYP